MASSSSQQRLFSDLHRDILFQISQYLDSPLDVLRFRAVCRPCRNSIPLPPQNPPPLQLPFPITPHPKRPADLCGHFLLTDSTFYAIQPLTNVSNPTKTWVIKTHPSKSSGCMVLENPLTTNPDPDLPPFGGFNLSKFFPEPFKLLDYKVIEVGKAYSLQFVGEGRVRDLSFGSGDITALNDIQWCFPTQVAVSSKLDKIDDEFAVMALDRGKLGVWRMSDKNWVQVTDKAGYVSILYHNRKFLALDFSGIVMSVDPVSLEMKNVCPELPYLNHGREGRVTYLVESFGDLLLVEKQDYISCIDEDDNYESPIITAVFKFNEGNHEWCEVGDGLKARSLFVCEDTSFSLLSKDFLGCAENSIYVSHGMGEEEEDHPGWDAFLFDMEKSTGGPLCEVCGCSNIFWPPPTWLKKNMAQEEEDIFLSQQLSNLKTF